MFEITKHAKERFKERVLNVSKDTEIEELEKKLNKDYHECVRNFDIYKNDEFIKIQQKKSGTMNLQFYVHPIKGHFYIVANDIINGVRSIVTVILPWDAKKRMKCKELCVVYEKILKQKEEELENARRKKNAKELEFYISSKPHIENKTKEWTL